MRSETISEQLGTFICCSGKRDCSGTNPQSSFTPKMGRRKSECSLTKVREMVQGCEGAPGTEVITLHTGGQLEPTPDTPKPEETPATACGTAADLGEFSTELLHSCWSCPGTAGAQCPCPKVTHRVTSPL